VNEFHMQNFLKPPPVDFNGLKPTWVSGRSCTCPPKWTPLLNARKDVSTKVTDIAWADLMLYEGKKWVCGKMQYVHVGSK